MAVKITFLALVLVASLITDPVWCAVDDPCPNGNEDCGSTEKCDTGTTKCVDRGTCVKATDCSGNGECKQSDQSCTCNPGFSGNDCSKDCGSATCTADQVCVGPDAGKVCYADPCKNTPCGANEDCSYEHTSVAPQKVCTCKIGYGGAACADGPECQASTECHEAGKPVCKKDTGKQFLCVAKGHETPNPTEKPKDECKPSTPCILPDEHDTDCTKLNAYIKCIEDANKTAECVPKAADRPKIKKSESCTPTDACTCQVEYWATDLTADNQPCTALKKLSSCLSSAQAKGCNDETKATLQENVDGTIEAKTCNAGVGVVSCTTGIIMAVFVAFFSM